jgi:hypothetical protein
MLTLHGTYNNGQLTLEQPIASEKPMKVMVTFLEDPTIPQKRGNPSLREALLNGPTITEEEYQVFVKQKEEWKNSRLSL